MPGNECVFTPEFEVSLWRDACFCARSLGNIPLSRLTNDFRHLSYRPSSDVLLNLPPISRGVEPPERSR